MRKRKTMTEKDRLMYECICLYIAQKGYSPTIREICDMTGVQSTSTVHARIKRLEEMGLIKKLAESPRTIVVV